MNALQDRKLLCHLKIYSPPQHDWYNVSFVEYTRDDNGKTGFFECNKRMHNCGDFLVGVNEIHLKGWDGNECFELINILLKDTSTAELRLTMTDIVLFDQYTKNSDNEDDEVQIMSPSKEADNGRQDMENQDASPNESEKLAAIDEIITEDYVDNFDATKHNDEVEDDVVLLQHQYAIAPGSEVDVDVMVHVKEIFYKEFFPIFEKARAGHSQMLDKQIYNK